MASDLTCDSIELNEPTETKEQSNNRLAFTNEAETMLRRYKQFGAEEDLENAITNFRKSLALHPDHHPDLSKLLDNLAVSLRKKFETRGRVEDLTESITRHRESLTLRPTGHPERAVALNNLAVAIRKQFEQTSSLEDLNEAIACYSEALSLCTPGSSDHSILLNNYALVVSNRFQISGKMEDLEEAITVHRNSLSLRPPGHPDRHFSLHNIALSIHQRYEHSTRLEDLEEAITCHRQALELRRHPHPYRALSLNGLAVALSARSDLGTGHTGFADLDEAILCHRESLSLQPEHHPYHSMVLINLSVALLKRSEDAPENLAELEEAITYLHEALGQTSLGNHDRLYVLSNLGLALFSRFAITSITRDLINAGLYLSEADNSIPTDHPMHALLQSRLAIIYLRLGDLGAPEQYLQMAFAAFEASASHPTSSIRSRLKAVLEWARAAQQYNHESTTRGFSTCLNLLSRYVVAFPNVELQQKSLAASPDIPKSLACDAAASAIQSGQLETAVELLEQGRAILWTKMRGYRHPLEALAEVDAQLAQEFEALSTQLEIHATSPDLRPIAPTTQNSFEVAQQQYRILSEKWDQVVEKIRAVTGFENFLRAVPFSTLREAAKEGPVIIVNISRYRSDAVIIQHVGPPVLVPLPDASLADVASMSLEISKPGFSSTPGFSNILGTMLRTLWETIVSPIVDQLTALGTAPKSRIWWCPTSELCALPLHAAGPFKPGNKNLPARFVCSYTPTLSALISARSGLTRLTSPPRMLLVAQPDQLLAVGEEVARIQQIGDNVETLIGHEASRTAVITGLQTHPWAHFACHGHRNAQPFQSSFELYDGEHLTLLELMKARLPNAELAFVSACHGAAADVQGTPDEVINLVAAVQFCGFRSVVGTLWAMADEDGPDVAQDFYRYMFRQPGGIDIRDAATALNLAIKEMRRRRGMNLGRWVNFVHIGA